MFINSQRNKGFTLIEVVIYIALFSLLMGTAFVTAYHLIEGSDKLKKKNTLQEEGNFVMRKLNWALTGLDPLNPPTITGFGCEEVLTLNKFNYPLNPIVITRNVASSSIEISGGGGVSRSITTANVGVTCLEFSILPPVGSGPSGVSATSTINGINFTITRYQRI